MQRNIALCGHNKCGTRWLRNVMASSPSFEVVSDFGEHGSLADNEEILRQRVQNSGRAFYFDCPYAIQNPETLALLKRIDPDVLPVVIYREPVEAMVSLHNYQRQRGSYRASKLYGAAMHVSLAGEKEIGDRDFVTSMLSGILAKQYEATYRYDRNASILRQEFDQFVELRYDDLASDAAGVVSQIFSAAGITIDCDIPTARVNRSISVKSAFIDRVIGKTFLLLTGLNTRQLFSDFADGRLRPSLYRMLLSANYRDPSFLRQAEVEKLREAVTPMVRQFNEITELDLSKWGYDLP